MRKFINIWIPIIGIMIGITTLIFSIWQPWKNSDKDMSGEWQMKSIITNSDYTKYEGMEVIWIIQLKQDGKKLLGAERR